MLYYRITIHYKMKKLIIFIWLAMVMSPVLAQDDDARRKIESARIALITDRLDLTPEQAEKFWPVYREYNLQRNELRKEFQDARGNVNRENLTEEESKRLLNLGMKIKEQQLALEKKYAERLSVIISNRQLLSLRKAEDDFRNMLLQRLEKRREMQRRMQRRRDQSDNN